ncbi:secretin and TonB N-terminal domain-containing protein [Sphingomonas sp. dw_22]|uniref:secretin and TonB N-terminal domain-containing protein n=1 Tax=Sphingomonas sp. dw_22 TaxID=2721175 RepID=UPI001BD2FB95
MTFFRPLPSCALLVAIGVSVMAAASAPAQEAGADQRVAFDIPAQPLDAALTQYFRATGVQLLYDSKLTAGRRSSAVQGTYAPREALQLLLRGTGLIARYSRASAAVITTPENEDAMPLVPLGRVVVREKIVVTRLSPVERMAFYGRLESELQGYLRGDKRTQQLVFTVQVSIRIADTGEVTEIRVDRGSGDAKKDRLLTEVLIGRTVSPPPDGIVQPLLVSLKGRHRNGD